MQRFLLFLFAPFFLLFLSCNAQNESHSLSSSQSFQRKLIVEIDTSGMTLESRYNPPLGFERKTESESSFAHFLRHLPMFPSNHKVKYYDGSIKNNNKVYSGVIDLPIGKKDLHQCADAVMRLRADYLRSQNRTSELNFHFTNGFLAEYDKWLEGNNILVQGNRVYYSPTGLKRKNTDENYWKFMEYVFTYAGTLSLSKELNRKSISDLQIGDVFIKGGSPGHAVIVLDVAINSASGEKCFLLGQSYMPAQEIQILIDPLSETGSSWFILRDENYLYTPEWTFSLTELKSF